MVFGRWWAFHEMMVDWEKDEPGAYELCDVGGTVVYIGSANEVRRSLLGHLGDTAAPCISRRVERYRVEYTHAHRERERELYDEFVTAHGRAPECNEVRP
jgi:hypothetical protein